MKNPCLSSRAFLKLRILSAKMCVSTLKYTEFSTFLDKNDMLLTVTLTKVERVPLRSGHAILYESFSKCVKEKKRDDSLT